MNQLSYVGMDVSAQTLEVASLQPGRSIEVLSFANSPSGHRQLLKAADETRPMRPRVFRSDRHL